MTLNLYEVLAVPPGASSEGIRRAYEIVSDPGERAACDASAKDRDEIEHLLGEATGLIDAQRWHEPIQPLQRILALDFNHALARRLIASCCVGLHDYDAAIPVLQVLVRQSPDDADAWVNLGHVYVLKSRHRVLSSTQWPGTSGRQCTLLC